MALFINTNMNSLIAQGNLRETTDTLGNTFKRLSSGMRINSARDDAAGLSIGTRMTAQIKGVSMAMRNANDGISMAQIADGAMAETTNALQRIRELAVQSASDLMTTGDRRDLQMEVTQLLSEIQRIANDTEFNGFSLLSGQFASAGNRLTIQVGAKSGQRIAFSINNVGLAGLFSMGTDAEGAEVPNLSLGGRSAAEAAIAQLDAAIDVVSRNRANLGAVQNRFQAVISSLSNTVENMSAARSRIMDADIAAETATLTQVAILQQAGTAVLAQANQQPQLALQLLQ